jgi:coenzyme F420 hydrogenase subunit beta
MFVFGREKKAEESFGVYRRLALAQAKNEEILKMGQDGGVVTALLLFALKNGLIDGAIVAGTSLEKPFLPVPRLATTSEEIVKCAGTKYCYSPNILALAEAVEQKKTNIAFVGTPCEVRAVRRMQMVGLRKFVAPVKFVIGLMCSECFAYEGLVKKHLGETSGLNLNSIRKINIKGKMLITTELGVKTISLAEAKQYARASCRFCDDFSAELADISAGGLGLDDWTFVVLRTEKGEELFSKAEKTGILNVKTVDNELNALNLLNKLSKKKKEAYPIP